LLPTIFVTAGKAIMWNVIVVVAGFAILLLSEMPPNQKLGLVCALGIITSLISVFLMLPILLKMEKFK